MTEFFSAPNSMSAAAQGAAFAWWRPHAGRAPAGRRFFSHGPKAGDNDMPVSAVTRLFRGAPASYEAGST
jgi:hypothetical protein